MSKFFSLEKKVVLVTGAGGHLGSGIAHRAASAGAHVYLNGRNAETLKNLEALIKAEGFVATSLPFDITDTQAIEENLKTISDRHGRLDGLVNNAAHIKPGSLDTANKQDFVQSFEANVFAVFDLCKHALPLLKREAGSKGCASIVNVASMYAIVSPDPSIYDDTGANNPPFYGAGKAAVIQLTRYLACHAAQMGIRSNTISPGACPPQSLADEKPEFYQKLCSKNPMMRIGNPEEIAAAAHFLLSDDAAYMNGANLVMDGGWTAW